MNKKLSVVLLGAALSLAACGGDSDSSGSNSNVTPPQFNALSNCAIQDNTIFVREVNKFTTIGPNRGCKVSRPELINGRTFSLECEIDSNDNQLFEIASSSNQDSRTIKNDIESINGNYKYRCLPQIRLPQAGPVTPVRPSTSNFS